MPAARPFGAEGRYGVPRAVGPGLTHPFGRTPMNCGAVKRPCPATTSGMPSSVDHADDNDGVRKRRGTGAGPSALTEALLQILADLIPRAASRRIGLGFRAAPLELLGKVGPNGPCLRHGHSV